MARSARGKVILVNVLSPIANVRFLSIRSYAPQSMLRRGYASEIHSGCSPLTPVTRSK